MAKFTLDDLISKNAQLAKIRQEKEREHQRLLDKTKRLNQLKTDATLQFVGMVQNLVDKFNHQSKHGTIKIQEKARLITDFGPFSCPNYDILLPVSGFVRFEFFNINDLTGWQIPDGNGTFCRYAVSAKDAGYCFVLVESGKNQKWYGCRSPWSAEIRQTFLVEDIESILLEIFLVAMKTEEAKPTTAEIGYIISKAPADNKMWGELVNAAAEMPMEKNVPVEPAQQIGAGAVPKYAQFANVKAPMPKIKWQ